LNHNRGDFRLENLTLLEKNTHNKLHGAEKTEKKIKRDLHDNVVERWCPKCKTFKPSKNFSVLKNGKAKSACKDCGKKLTRDYVKRNRGKVLAKAAAHRRSVEYRAWHKDYVRKWYLKNRERILTKQKVV